MKRTEPRKVPEVNIKKEPVDEPTPPGLARLESNSQPGEGPIPIRKLRIREFIESLSQVMFEEEGCIETAEGIYVTSIDHRLTPAVLKRCLDDTFFCRLEPCT